MAGAQMMMGIFNSFVNGMNQARQAQQQARINQALTLNNQGIALYNQGRYQDAVSAFQRAVALKPNDQNMRNNLLLAQQKLAAQGEAAMAASHQQMEAATQRVDAMLGNLDAQVSRQDAASKAGLDFAGGPAPAGTSFFGTGGGPGSPHGGAAAQAQARGLDFATDNESLFSKGYHGSAPPDLRHGSFSTAAAPTNAGAGKQQGLDFATSAPPAPSSPPAEPTPVKLAAVAPPPAVTVPDVAGHSARERAIVVDAIQSDAHNAAAADLHLRELLAKNPRDQDLRDAESYLSGWVLASNVAGGHAPPVSDEHAKNDMLSPKPGLESLNGGGAPKDADEMRLLYGDNPAIAQFLPPGPTDVPKTDMVKMLHGDDPAIASSHAPAKDTVGLPDRPQDPKDWTALKDWKMTSARIFAKSWGAHRNDFTAVRKELEAKAKADPHNMALRDALRMAQGAEAQQIAENGAPIPAK